MRNIINQNANSLTCNDLFNTSEIITIIIKLSKNEQMNFPAPKCNFEKEFAKIIAITIIPKAFGSILSIAEISFIKRTHTIISKTRNCNLNNQRINQFNPQIADSLYPIFSDSLKTLNKSFILFPLIKFTLTNYSRYKSYKAPNCRKDCTSCSSIRKDF